jgi:hypothetical protein
LCQGFSDRILIILGRSGKWQDKILACIGSSKLGSFTASSKKMPKICQFFGIMIYIHFRDHLPPHFHAQYGEFEGIVGVNPVRLLQGDLPPRVLGLVIEWATLYSEELSNAWEAVSNRRMPNKIPPLK